VIDFHHCNASFDSAFSTLARLPLQTTGSKPPNPLGGGSFFNLMQWRLINARERKGGFSSTTMKM
jgi:hypothetical protein